MREEEKGAILEFCVVLHVALASSLINPCHSGSAVLGRNHGPDSFHNE